MKVLVILSLFVALSACEVLPLIPGDNRHYVEGKSRYVWMPDGEGNPHLVDLEAPIDMELLRQVKAGSNNQYFLYTRDNPEEYQLLVIDDADSILNSYYNGTKSTKVIAHGWHSSGTADWNLQIVESFLTVDDVNVIIVDWEDSARHLYTIAALSVDDVGRNVASFLDFVFETAGGNWTQVHLAGHSLGAHVVGNAGRTAQTKPKRITGMDPAGPLFTGSGSDNALNKECADYVEIIHTDAGLLGLSDAIGHVDFYPNGGGHPQPGCLISTCSHGRSHQLFASSIRTNHLTGRKCTNYEEARDNQCTGDSFDLGNADINKTGEGLYALSTNSRWPF